MAKRMRAAEKLRAERIGRIRTAILERLESMGKSALWLAQQVKGVHNHTSQAFLYSGRDMRVSAVAEMMEIVGLKLSKGRPIRSRAKKKAVT